MKERKGSTRIWIAFYDPYRYASKVVALKTVRLSRESNNKTWGIFSSVTLCANRTKPHVPRGTSNKFRCLAQPVRWSLNLTVENASIDYSRFDGGVSKVSYVKICLDFIPKMMMFEFVLGRKVSLSTLFFRFFGTDVAAYQCLHVPCRIPRCTLLLFNYPLLSTLSAAVYPVACQEFISSEERLRSLYTKFWILPALAAFAPRV